MKENLIREYMAGVNFKGDWSVSKIIEDMKRFLGEEPGIDILWKKDAMLNESTGLCEIVEEIDKVVVVFFSEDDRFKKLEFLIK